MLFSFVKAAPLIKHFGTFSNFMSVIIPFSPRGHFWPFLSFRFDEVSIKRDVNVHIVTVDGVLTLTFVETDPDFVALLQRQHDALALHDGAVAGLSVNDGLLAVIMHDVQVRLLEVPRVDVHIEEVDSWDLATVLPGKHVEVFGGVHKDGVKDQGLVVVNTVKGLPSAH